MAAKRSATSELNHLNWDQEDEPEERGTFKIASEDTLKKRVIKTARRRNPVSTEDSANKPNVFSGFTAFNKTPTSTTFSFLNNKTEEPKKEEPKTNGTSITANTFKSSPASTTAPMFTSTVKTTPSNMLDNKPEEYYAKLKGLNESVSKWIKSHVDENPFVNLSPIFKDYEKYFNEIEGQKNNDETKTNLQKATFKFGSSEEKKDESKAVPGFSFSKSADGNEATKFSFGSSSTKTSEPFAFSAKPVTDNDSDLLKAKSSLSKPGFTFTSTSDTKATAFGASPGFNIGASTVSPSSKPFSTNTSDLSHKGASSKKLSVDSVPPPGFGINPLSFGATPTTSFGGTTTTGFGATSTSGFGATSTPGLGSSTAFGATATSGLGATATTGFGATSTTGFGSTSTSGFGKTSTAPFGSSPSPFASSGQTGFGTNTSSGFSSPFTFKNVAPTSSSTSTESKGEEGDEEDQPPKVEFTAVEEEGHVYKIRCKVFVKKDGKFTDRGVGNLFLKPVENSEKTQLIVRADTNLGNLLLNFILSKAIPTQRMGNKDVMVVCIPTPDSKPPPTPILLRVKSGEEADNLLKTLEKYKK